VVLGSAGQLLSYDKASRNQIVQMGNAYGGDGLATVVLDLNRIQKMLFKVPSGK